MLHMLSPKYKLGLTKHLFSIYNIREFISIFRMKTQKKSLLNRKQFAKEDDVSLNYFLSADTVCL
jgi:hypothetical protein